MKKYSKDEYLPENCGIDSRAKAIYHKQIVSSYKDNVFIEAIHNPVITKEDQLKYFSKPISNYDYARDSKRPLNEKAECIRELKNLRICLPFMSELNQSFFNSLRDSYSNRHIKKHVTADGIEEYRLLGDVASAANSGFALLGHSGTGKSSAIGMVLKLYPQVIEHEIDGNRFVQITYLIVSCENHSNFSSLFLAIGKAIDRALDTGYCYEKMIKAINTVGGKRLKIQEFIEKFAIGTIILDEIQLISFNAHVESSFTSFMTMTNETKVAVSVIGTDSAYDKIMAELQTARRIGKLVSASAYCDSPKFYPTFLNEIFQYQWFNEKVTLSDDIIRTFKEITGGIASQTIDLYISVHEAWFKNTKSVINSDFIRKVANKEMKHIESLIRTRDMRLGDMKNVSVISDIKTPQTKSQIAIKRELIADQMLAVFKVFVGPSLSEEVLLEKINEAVSSLKEKDLNEEKAKEKIYRLLSKTSKARTKRKKLTAEEIDARLFEF